MKVLLIDDDADVTEAVPACFDAGWPGTTVVSASNGMD